MSDPAVAGWCVTDEGEIAANSGRLRVEVRKTFTFLRQSWPFAGELPA